MIPTIGRIVHYRLNAHDARQINMGRLEFYRRGNPVKEGDVFPMMITCAWGSEPTSSVNGQVFLDGDDVYWAKSVVVGEGPGTFSWPQRV